MNSKGIRALLVGAIATSSLLGAASTGVASAAPTTADTAKATASAYDQKISRTEVMKRAKYWIDKRVPYSQKLYYRDIEGKKTYRQYCSGYVSMAWKLSSSRVVSVPANLGLVKISHKIGYSQLKPGDVMVKMGQHITLFAGWKDSKHTAMRVWQEGRPGTVASESVWPTSTYKSYIPMSYNKITG